MMRLALGGGCHWCTEAVFQALHGVANVRQGFACGPWPHTTWSEAVLLDLDAVRLPLAALVEIHLRTHASTSAHGLRGKYRSAIYVPGATDRTAAEAVLAALQASFDAPLVTRVLDLVAFKPSDPRFQNYYANGPKRPFCVSYIEPKLQMLRVRYGAFVTSSASSQTASSMP